MSVGELEALFAAHGFDVVVFIRSGKFWLDIPNKKHSLYEENLLGESLSHV
jgi:hypothetical protein